MARDGRVYEDELGRCYLVPDFPLGKRGFKAHYYEPHRAGGFRCRNVPWRKSWEEAQADLDELAAKRGWKEI